MLEDLEPKYVLPSIMIVLSSIMIGSMTALGYIGVEYNYFAVPSLIYGSVMPFYYSKFRDKYWDLIVVFIILAPSSVILDSSEFVLIVSGIGFGFLMVFLFTVFWNLGERLSQLN